ncbi:hypothetical protein [Anaeroselena agilis]|uniref:Uncharacterized protein n=1 Tax=Anaeroselena agilis TaxID=3063788 RepID=A0ABU3P5R5_9FIRM|nr:hypothetical protein [Selenomonadales bacterium 4137-cl]
MKLEQDMSLINELENEFPVQHWTIADIHIWPLIRIPLSFTLNAQGSEAKRYKTTGDKRILNKIRQIISFGSGALRQLSASLKDNQHNDCTERADVLIISATKDRLLKLPNGQYYDIHCDYISDAIKKLGKRVLTYEIAPQNHYLLPRYSISHFSQAQLDWIRIKAEIEFLANRKPLAKVKLPSYDDFRRALEERNIYFSLPSPEQLLKQVFVISRTAAYFEKVIKSKRISLAMVCDYCSTAGLAMNLACRRMGIISVDIQHGVAGNLHGSYSRWTKVPLTGYELLPKIFWCWSEDDVATINSWNNGVMKYHQAIVGGNSWEELWLDPKNEIGNYYDKILAKEFPGKINEKRILVTLQTGGLIPPVIVQTIKEAPSSWRWYIRFHPYMTQEERNHINKELDRECRQANIDLTISNTLPLMALLRNVDVMITEWSATVIDAKIMKTPSVVVHRYAEEYFAREIEQGWVRPAYNPPKILAAITDQISAKEMLRSKELIVPSVSKALEAVKILLNIG